MKFSEIISEYTTINAVKDINDKFIQEKCPIAYKVAHNGGTIFRGIGRFKRESTTNIFYGDSSHAERKSANTENFYTILIDHILSQWKDYPKRSRSFICTSNINIALNYMYYNLLPNAFEVFPMNNPVIGICSERDFWVSFKNISAPNINEIFRTLLNIFTLDFNDDINTVKTVINYANSNWNNIIHEIEPYLYHKEKYNLSEFENFTAFLDWLMDPERNRFKLVHLSELDNLKLKDNEIWFSGPAYFEQINF